MTAATNRALFWFCMQKNVGYDEPSIHALHTGAQCKQIRMLRALFDSFIHVHYTYTAATTIQYGSTKILHRFDRLQCKATTYLQTDTTPWMQHAFLLCSLGAHCSCFVAFLFWVEIMQYTQTQFTQRKDRRKERIKRPGKERKKERNNGD